jgi:hypothetical protein
VTQYQWLGRRARQFAAGHAKSIHLLKDFNMYARTLGALATMLMAGAGVSRAGDLDLHVILSGQVAPGVYGQVRLGSDPPPPVVYAQPMLIEPQASPPPPVYLHVPPGHAQNWRKHCHEYHACGRPVYFVRSEEYAPGYRHRDYGHDHDHGHGHGKHDDRDHDRR